MRKFVLSDWSLIPGPACNPPPSSLDLHDFIEYSPSTIAETILAFPGMIAQNHGDPTWWEWSATWRHQEASIDVGMTLFEIEPVSWGGSPLRGGCSVPQMLALWNSVRQKCPGVWMHNSDCEIHTPESFEGSFADDLGAMHGHGGASH